MALSLDLYFAWVNSTDDTYIEDYARNDETVLGYRLEQREGEFATLFLDIKAAQGISLLSALRKQWGWFSYRLDTDLVPRFFGRLVGIQTVNSDSGNVVTIQLVAEPIDYTNQKKAVADSKRVLPRYDRVFIDERNWDDDDIVLEGYPERYHTDPVTHVVSTSNELIGEDGVTEFSASDILYGGFIMEASGTRPANAVTVTADLKWTQQAQGQISLTNYFINNWTGAISGAITSYTFQASSWPSVGASIGSGWTVASSSCFSKYDTTVRSIPFDTGIVINWGDWGGGSTSTSVKATGSDDVVNLPPGSIHFPSIVTTINEIPKYDEDGELVSWSYSSTWTDAVIPLIHLVPTLVAEYKASRECTEIVSFTLISDIQPMVGEDSQALPLEPINLQTSNLSDTFSEGTAEETPIDDPRRRSYICTDRGQQSLQYLIARAQTALLLSARAVEIEFRPKFERMRDVTLRKNARVHRGEIPGGVAEGKIIAIAEEMARGSGTVDCRVRIGCAIGRGGVISQVDGVGTYVEDDYIEAGHFEESGGTELFDSSVGFTPPLFDPNDDGLDFIGGFNATDAIDTALSVTNPFTSQQAAIFSQLNGFFFTLQGEDAVEARNTAVNAVLNSVKTSMSFKLKSMTREFESPYEIDVTGLKVPTMIDLEAA